MLSHVTWNVKALHGHGEGFDIFGSDTERSSLKTLEIIDGYVDSWTRAGLLPDRIAGQVKNHSQVFRVGFSIHNARAHTFHEHEQSPWGKLAKSYEQSVYSISASRLTTNPGLTGSPVCSVRNLLVDHSARNFMG